ncbi:MAG: SDR family oxidoreductase [Chlorobiaceae bacterium]|nr:SDR family oxidoreductase [Chlorobiaceae bacterium]
MNVLVTGNAGYIGPVLAKHLRASRPGIGLTGYDAGYFAHCLTNARYLPEFDYDRQYWGDMRVFTPELLDDVDAVVHLAAISNDPMGKRFESVTADINFNAGITMAKEARARGVKNFVFASSCSMYGYAEGGPRTENDELNPLTAYARSKVAMEQGLATLAGDGFTVTALRFATACGMSDRLRLDLVLNDFVACAVTSGEITVLSDGSPWRPLINVRDMSRAIDWAIDRPASHGGAFLAVNAGSGAWNYQVKELARAVAEVVPGTKVAINEHAQPDKRSYRVDFTRFSQLAPDHQPRVTLEEAIRELKDGLDGMKFNDADFRNSKYMRLRTLEGHIGAGRLDEHLAWTGMHLHAC